MTAKSMKVRARPIAESGGAAKGTSMIAHWQQFRKDLNGFAMTITFADFRDVILPLARRSAWSEADVLLAKSYVAQGAGPAVRRLAGKGHEDILGESAAPEAPMSRSELETHLRLVIDSSLRDGWPPERFEAFVKYLDSAMTPRDFVDQTKEKKPPAIPTPDTADESKLTRGARRRARARAEAKEADTVAPDRDAFAEMYRKAGPAFKQTVRTQFHEAAAHCRKKLAEIRYSD